MCYETGFAGGDRLPELMCVAEPILTRGLVDELQAAGVSNLECFPAELKSSRDGTVWNHYVAVNVVGAVACADLARSQFEDVIDTPGGGRLYSFSDLKVDATKALDAPLFRLAESPSTLLMHERVVHLLIAARSARERRITFIDRS